MSASSLVREPWAWVGLLVVLAAAYEPPENLGVRSVVTGCGLVWGVLVGQRVLQGRRKAKAA